MWFDAPGLPWSCSLLAPTVPHVLVPRDLSQYARMRHQDKCNALGAKSNIPYDHKQLNHLNPYGLFTKLPLAFLVLS
jgi:hypothetical protein